MIERNPRVPVCVIALRAIAARALREREIDCLHLEHALVRFPARSCSVRMRLSDFVEVFERRHNRKPADEFRNEPVLEQILGLDVAEDLALLAVLRRHHFGAESDRG